MKNIPFLLILARFLIALIIPFIGYFSESAGIIIITLMFIGLITDIYDGKIARRLNIATQKLRTYDSNVDLVFWLSVIITLFSLNHVFFYEQCWLIFSLIFLELCCYLVAYFRFKKTVATHSILAKIWTLTLILFLVDLAWNHTSFIPFWCCIVLGILSRVEILMILIRLDNWTTDVPTLFSVAKINQGIEPKRYKIFN